MIKEFHGNPGIPRGHPDFEEQHVPFSRGVVPRPLPKKLSKGQLKLAKRRGRAFIRWMDRQRRKALARMERLTIVQKSSKKKRARQRAKADPEVIDKRRQQTLMRGRAYDVSYYRGAKGERRVQLKTVDDASK